ncbi:ABC transporter substrate-binding protein [Cohnella sp. REN36]|uniref:ABC transporter substrate-binding protein n=1 Tax=Cohnella sp. REN36 TaxID=2887347 RepID=UPI001D15390B|nr:extracellular solute-binding protein [Cohnella sp. REN36]MCC3375744.1 extracellular solute-binding protein [Cohnella sp. REN36]
MKKSRAALLLLTALALSLSGCTGKSSKEVLKPLDEKEEAKFKIMFWDQNYFFQEYGNLFLSKFPNLDIEVVDMQSIYSADNSDPEHALEKFVDEKQPDVLLLSLHDYEKLGKAGKLYPLDPVIKQDGFDIEGIHPAVLSLLREKGDGKLQGLSPTFSSKALYYNVDLFQKYGVEPPTDSMTWEEILALAKRFPTGGSDKDRIYGLNMDTYETLESLVSSIASTEKLKLLDADAKQVLIDGDAWKKTLQTAADGVKSKTIRFASEEERNKMQGAIMMDDLYKMDLFLTGRAAMMVSSGYEAQKLRSAKERMKDVKPVNWEAVTMPVDPGNRSQGGTVDLYNIFAVNAKSTNLRAAWEFVKYVNSEESAKIKSKNAYSGDFLSRTAYNKDPDGKSLEAFFKLDPQPSTTIWPEKTPGGGLYTDYVKAVNEQLGAVAEGKKTLDEAASAMKEQLTQALVVAREADAKKQAEQASASPSAE